MATRLELPNNQWIEVKDKLKVRDKRDVHSYSVDGMATDGLTYRFNVVKHQIATAAVRIIRWSLQDDGSMHKDGQPKPIEWPNGQPFKARVEAIEGLDEEAFEEITEALNKHLRVVEAADEDAKKEIPAGETTSTPSSPSAS